MDIKFSIIAPAIRAERYRSFCDSIERSNSVSYEVIFAGFNPPIEDMPDNFTYIVTQVNPAWALEVAARHAVGEYLVFVSDDSVFSKGYFDKIDYYVNKIAMKNAVVGGRFKVLNGEFRDHLLTCDADRSTSPVALIAPAFKREIWKKLGGIDSRFIYGLCDLDILMRFYEYGYHPFVMPDAYVDEDLTDADKGASVSTIEFGRKLINKFWVKDGVYSNKRLLPVLPITDDSIKSAVESVINYSKER